MQRSTAKQITAILTQGESETIEFKKVFNRETVETLCAFANTNGGRVLVGVSDAGRVLGVEVGKETIQNWIKHPPSSRTAHASKRTFLPKWTG